LDAPTFHTGFRNIIGETGYHFLLDNRVLDDITFEKVYPYLLQMMNACLNYLDQYQTLQDFYNYGENMPIQEQANFYNQPLTARKMIVKKLLNISDYSTYVTTVITNANLRGDVERTNFLQALKNHLDTL